MSCKNCDDRMAEFKQCLKELDRAADNLCGYNIPPAPVVERFVMWDKDETVESATRGLIKRDDWFTRRKRGYVVAEPPKTLNGIKCPYWCIQFSNGDFLTLNEVQYERLKRNGCFGEQVK